MAYDFNCPYCAYGHNIEDCAHEDDWNKPGEFECKCKHCKKEFIIEAEAIIDYDTRKKADAEGK
ncbi:hypothetical protein F895_02641 [Acinetobacter sp. CIP 64.2]|uniref:hypothetical protein n=1 Tax=Acinetobacter sp. CIP 64.2 TaxID=1217694 RepID=UPI00028888FA|nr:hypothetical protein [Acinetobacter sp. CIP 64.2]ENX13337.1 hypothetical protein F895_02641 [Acinetobacter sp. CIP 64.2]